MRTLGVVVVVTLLAGCGGPKLIVLHNPATGQTAQCQGDPLLHLRPSAATESCAQGYEAAGYKRVSSY
jgi:hypothetical protein